MSCNVLSDHEIRNVVTGSREPPLCAQQVYGCLGCSIEALVMVRLTARTQRPHRMLQPRQP
jgi:hypothetical protein